METTEPVIYMPSEQDYIHILEDKIKELEITIKKQQATIDTIMKRLEKLEELDDEGDESDDEKCNDTDLTTDEEECTENTDNEKPVENKLRYEQLKQALFRRKQQDEECIIM